MKILMIMNNVDYGGAALAFIELIEEINNLYPDIKIIVLTGSNNNINKRLNKMNIENYYLPFKNFISNKRTPRFIWDILFKIRHFIGDKIATFQVDKIINFDEIDLIYTNLDRIDFGAKLSKKYNQLK